MAFRHNRTVIGCELLYSRPEDLSGESITGDNFTDEGRKTERITSSVNSRLDLRPYRGSTILSH
jgi:hypothetical protein